MISLKLFAISNQSCFVIIYLSQLCSPLLDRLQFHQRVPCDQHEGCQQEPGLVNQEEEPSKHSVCYGRDKSANTYLKLQTAVKLWG